MHSGAQRCTARCTLLGASLRARVNAQGRRSTVHGAQQDIRYSNITLIIGVHRAPCPGQPTNSAVRVRGPAEVCTVLCTVVHRCAPFGPLLLRSMFVAFLWSDRMSVTMSVNQSTRRQPQTHVRDHVRESMHQAASEHF